MCLRAADRKVIKTILLLDHGFRWVGLLFAGPALEIGTGNGPSIADAVAFLGVANCIERQGGIR